MPLITALIGVIGGLYAAKLTDVRRAKDADNDVIRRFRSLSKLMPDLIAEMKEDIGRHDCQTVREFWYCHSSRASINSNQVRFRYDSDEHEDLLGKLRIMENHGFIDLVDDKGSTLKIFSISEEFVSLLREHPRVPKRGI